MSNFNKIKRTPITNQSQIQNNSFWKFAPEIESSTPTSSPKNNLETNAKYAFDYFVRNGIPKVVAAGITANLWHENLANPEQTISDSRGATSYGIACFNSKGELNNLRDFAKSNGLSNLNLDTQLGFLTHVVKTRIPKILNATTPEDASFIFGRDFERFAGASGQGYKDPNDPEHIKRKKTAKKLYNTHKS